VNQIAPRFTVVDKAELELRRPEHLADFYTLSPFVWKDREHYVMLLRVVNRSDNPAEKIARIHRANGETPLRFVLEDEPVIAPGPDSDDRDGCEDPSVASDDGCYRVYYTGWNEKRREGNLMWAKGADIETLVKCGRVFTHIGRFRNAKEATIVRCDDGTWRLFFEFAEDDKSKIGIAMSRSADGPWTFEEPPFSARPGRWDCWHLSTGPISLADPSRPTMFYNGADRDAHWRIGWVEFDACCTTVTARSDGPIIVPPLQKQEPEDTDIVFAASTVEEMNGTALYYSMADRLLMRVLLARANS